MNSDDDDLSSLKDGHWRIQPKWVKVLTVGVAVPAWLLFMRSVFTGHVGGTLSTVAFIAFAAVAALQMAFVFRAYWRMDL
jgi:hypothetical protein